MEGGPGPRWRSLECAHTAPDRWRPAQDTHGAGQALIARPDPRVPLSLHVLPPSPTRRYAGKPGLRWLPAKPWNVPAGRAAAVPGTGTTKHRLSLRRGRTGPRVTQGPGAEARGRDEWAHSGRDTREWAPGVQARGGLGAGRWGPQTWTWAEMRCGCRPLRVHTAEVPGEGGTEHPQTQTMCDAGTRAPDISVASGRV